MSSAVDPSLRNLNDCGCCAGVTVETPVEVVNRPGLSAIAYRVGTARLKVRSHPGRNAIVVKPPPRKNK